MIVSAYLATMNITSYERGALIMQNIKGKNAIITGGIRGIGLATAHASAIDAGGTVGIGLRTAHGVANEGVNVAITGRSREPLDNAVEELNKCGVQVIAANGDGSSREEVGSMIASINETFSTIDILINNAGIMRHTPFLESSEDEFRNMMDVNVFGPYYTMQSVLPQMTAQKKGDVINISSMSG